MRWFPRFAAGAAVFAAVIGTIESTQAQTARTGSPASAQLMQQMQQLASERTSLQAENAKLKKDLEDLRKERDAFKSGELALDKRVKSSESSLKDTLAKRQSGEQELADTKDKMQQLIVKFRETAQELREVETDRATVKQTAASREEDLKLCVDRNLSLYKLNTEVLTRLENQGVWGRMARAEPFTQVKRVELENLVDEYKSRADEQLLKSEGSPPATPDAPTAPASAAAPAAPPNR